MLLLGLIFVLGAMFASILMNDSPPNKLSLAEIERRVAANEVETAKLLDRDHMVVGKLKSGLRYSAPYPEQYGDELTTKLLASGVDLNADAQKPSLLTGLLFTLLPTVLVLGVLMWFISKAAPGGRGVMQFSKSKARRFMDDSPAVTFADVAGNDEAIEELIEIRDFLSDPQQFRQLGARIPRGVLLYGPPGTGKTLIARAIAGEASVPFYTVSGSDFVEMFVGVGAARVRDLFQQAKAESPAIVFIDEIDAVGRQRGQNMTGANDEREQTLNQLLVEMDGFDNDTGVIVIAGTNRPDILDQALLRPGRFDRQVAIDKPDLAGRQAILRVHAKGRPLANDVDLDVIARRTPGFTGADLSNILNEAAILTARRRKELIGNDEVLQAVDRVMAGPERRSKIISDADKRLIAYHEAGHALVGHLSEHCDPIHKVSIIARGQALGVTISLPETDRILQRESELRAQITMLLGGRCAEELVFGDVTGGAQNDIERATQIAQVMVTELGMSTVIGLRQIDMEHESTAVREVVAAEVSAIISRAQTDSFTILRANRGLLDTIATRLIEHETLDAEEFLACFENEVPVNG